MVKYPIQCMIGGTLLLTLAFSLNDGSGAQESASSKLNPRVACGGFAVRQPPPVQAGAALHNGCLAREAKN